MRVQVGEHAADGVSNQLLVVDRFHVPGLDGVEHLGKGPQFRHGQTGSCFLVGDCRKLQADQNATKQSGANQSGLFQLTHLSHSCVHLILG